MEVITLIARKNGKVLNFHVKGWVEARLETMNLEYHGWEVEWK